MNGVFFQGKTGPSDPIHLGTRSKRLGMDEVIGTACHTGAYHRRYTYNSAQVTCKACLAKMSMPGNDNA